MFKKLDRTLMTEVQEYLVNDITAKIALHNLRSGEIIFGFQPIASNVDPKACVVDFFRAKSIKSYPDEFDLSERTQQQALHSINYGLSTKLNYTRIDIQFNEHDKNEIVYAFFQLFDKPRFYSINTQIYQSELDVFDFWESGGTIAIDNSAIGVIWVNDLYGR